MPLGVGASAAVPPPDVTARLVWSTMIAVDNANRTGNYTVLHALGSPRFQAKNSPVQLAQVFASLRRARIDVGKAILVTPQYQFAPAIDVQGMLRLRGGFEFRPQAIRFDILFEFIDGGWQIFALSVAQMDSAAP